MILSNLNEKAEGRQPTFTIFKIVIKKTCNINLTNLNHV